MDYFPIFSYSCEPETLETKTKNRYHPDQKHLT